MTIIDLFTIVVIVTVCTAVAQAIFDFRREGVILSLILGTFGAFVGIQLARALELPDLFTVHVGTLSIPIIWSIMGSGLFAIILSVFIRRI